MEVDGGPGADRMHGYVNSRISYADRTVGVRLIQDGLANDGEPGEGDNVTGRFWHVEGGAGDDELHPVAGECCGLPRNSTLDGRGGDDRLFGSNSSDQIRGGEGDDEIYSLGGEVDWLTGGPGGDLIRGGDGRDSALGYGEPAPVSITLDNRPGDGVPGEKDDVGSGRRGGPGHAVRRRLSRRRRGLDPAEPPRAHHDRRPRPLRGHDHLRTRERPAQDQPRRRATPVRAGRGRPAARALPHDARRKGSDADALRDQGRRSVRGRAPVRAPRRRGRCCGGRARFDLPARGRSVLVSVRLARAFRRELRRAGAMRAAFQVVAYRTTPGPRKLEKPVPGRTPLAPRY